jgi:hypothetical protein
VQAFTSRAYVQATCNGLYGGTLSGAVFQPRTTHHKLERSMKKFAMLAVAFAFTLSLVGCGPTPTTAPAATPEKKEEKKEEKKGM